MWINKNGYAQERIKDPDTGLEKIISVKVKGSSEKARVEAFRKLQDKITHISDKKVLLSDAIKIYIKENERSLKPSSLRKCRIELNSFLQIVGDSYINSLSAGYIRSKLLDSGKENRTLNGYLKIFKTFWLWAYRNDIADSREVFDKLTPFQDTPKRARIQDKYLEPWELSKLIEAMTVERWVLMTELLATSGLRIGEVIGLDNCDVWGSLIHVNKTYDANNKILTEPKTLSSKRDVYVQEELREIIDKIREYVKRQNEIFGVETDIFFPDPEGGRLKYYSYSTYLREVSERVLGRRITPHTLRHTHCSMLAAKGMNLEAISARLGHDDSRITKEIYFHRLEEMKEKENRQLDGIKLLRKA